MQGQLTATQPRADELEVSLFGPGYGECVLVHLGDGQWMIVDSCRDQRRRIQPALRYLNRIGVDVATAVRLVVATHWHADHVRGLTEVVGACINADFWTSQALTSREARLLAGTIGATELTAQSPLRELHGVLQRLIVRSEGTGRASIKTVVAGATVYQRIRNEVKQAEVKALSPHDEAVEFARQAFDSTIQEAAPGTFPAPDVHPNHAAIALKVRVGDAVAILGSDLENDAPGGGWQAIVQTEANGDRAVYYKVAHHGSITSHEPAIWDRLLASDVVAALTPYRSQRLPRPEMVQRIVDQAGQAFATAPPIRPSQRQRPRRINALMQGSAIRVEDTEGRSGHVRFRCASVGYAHADFGVELRLPALRLESLL